MGSFPVSFTMPLRTELNTGGTTDATMQSRISSTLAPKRSSMSLISTPYSSEVLVASVARRASKRISPPGSPQGDVAVPNINGQKHVSHSIPAPDRDRSFLAPLYRNGPRIATRGPFLSPRARSAPGASSAPQGGHRQSALQQPELDLARHSVPVGEQVAVLPHHVLGSAEILLHSHPPPPTVSPRRPHSYAERPGQKLSGPLAYGVIRPVWAPPGPQAPPREQRPPSAGVSGTSCSEAGSSGGHPPPPAQRVTLSASSLHTALGLQLRNAGVVGLNGRLSLADPSAGGGIGPSGAAPAPRSTAGPAPGTPS